MKNKDVNVELKKDIDGVRKTLFPFTHSDNVLIGDPSEKKTLTDKLESIEKNGGSGSVDLSEITKKLDTIESGAEENQNSISSIIVGSATISASEKTDSITFIGSNVTLTGNELSKSVQIGLTKSNVVNALGFTPYTQAEVKNLLSSLETNIDWKEAVDTFSDIATIYPNPEDGWTVNVKDTDYTYRYNGSMWVVISANAIPKATNGTDGLLSKEDHIKYEDANAKKHEHANKAILDAITAIYTSEEKTKLTGIETGANNYTHPTTSGNKHIPSGGSTGQVLKWSEDGTAVWADETGGGVRYDIATTSADGLMSSSDKTKLDGIDSGANKTTVDSTLSTTSTNPVQNKIVAAALNGKASSDHTHTSLTGITSLTFALASDVTDTTNPVIGIQKELTGYVGAGTAVYGTVLTLNTSIVPTTNNAYSIGNSGYGYTAVYTKAIYNLSELRFSVSNYTTFGFDACYNSSISSVCLNSPSLLPSNSVSYLGSSGNPWKYGYYNYLYLKNGDYMATLRCETYTTTSGTTSAKLMVGASICPFNNTMSIGVIGSGWQNIYTARLFSSDGTYGFYLNSGNVELQGNMLPISNASANIGSSSYVFSGMYTNNIYTKAFETEGCNVIAPHTLNSSSYTSTQVGTQGYPFSIFYASSSYRFSDGTWWNGLFFTSYMSVPYGSSGRTDSGRGLEIGESGLQLKVSTSVVYFNCTNGIKTSDGWYTTSDEKVKIFTDDIDIDSNSLSKLFDIIKIRSFKYKYTNDKVVIGLNAEELEKDMESIDLDPLKYGILTIDYNTCIPRGDGDEDDKFYTKFASISYEKLATLAIFKMQDMEKKHTARMNSIEERLAELEKKG